MWVAASAIGKDTPSNVASRLPERPALLHVGHGLLERDLGDAEAGERDADAVVVEALHHLVEAACPPRPSRWEAGTRT